MKFNVLAQATELLYKAEHDQKFLVIFAIAGVVIIYFMCSFIKSKPARVMVCIALFLGWGFVMLDQLQKAERRASDAKAKLKEELEKSKHEPDWMKTPR